MNVQSGFAAINGAEIYYEMAGDGQPLVMIHAGVADRRQWNNEFAHFAESYRVLRYDLRGYGKSELVEGEFSHMEDLIALLDHLDLRQPLILMGCSMGGGLAMDFTLAHPARAKALIMVGSSPSGLELDVPTPPKFAEAEKAYEARDWDMLAELGVEIWFDGMNRTPDKVNPEARELALEMIRLALVHEAKEIGKRLPDAETPAAERLIELNIPVLVVAGEHDVPYILAAADYMVDHIPSARKAMIKDAAHLPNMDHPAEFQHLMTAFLGEVDSKP